MLYLNLGVNDIRYTAGPTAPRRVVVRKHRSGVIKTFTAAAPGQETTGDVAQILEEKYNILETFSREYEKEIADALSHALVGAIQILVMGNTQNADPYASAALEIETAMKLFLDMGGMDGSGNVPTKAALRGVNRRLKHPYAKGNPSRPSFIDTGTMQSNYRAWTSKE